MQVEKKFNGLMILGAGDFAREVHGWVLITGADISAFYSDKTAEVQVHGFPIVTKMQNDGTSFYQVTAGTGNPQLNQRLFNYAKMFGHELAKPVLSDCTVGIAVRVGVGSVICPGVKLTTNIKLGLGSVVNINATVGHDVETGDFCVIGPGANISGRVKMGDRVYVGTGAMIREGVTIGDDAVIGMGAVVLKDVPAGTTVVGNPAKPLQKAEQ